MGFDRWQDYGQHLLPSSDTGEKADRELKPGQFGKECLRYSLRTCRQYMWAALAVHLLIQSDPSSLTACVFAFFGVELVALATIKITDRRKKLKNQKEETNAEADSTHE